MKALTNRYTTTAFVVLTAAALAFITGADGKGALTLWPLFGAVNQLLAGMALIVITIYLKKKRKGLTYLITAIPALIILIMTIWAIFLNEFSYWESGQGLLVFINALVFCLAIWMVIEGLISVLRRTDQG